VLKKNIETEVPESEKGVSPKNKRKQGKQKRELTEVRRIESGING
jgi:hypothetical protein